jgi:hypothetical protein
MRRLWWQACRLRAGRRAYWSFGYRTVRSRHQAAFYSRGNKYCRHCGEYIVMRGGTWEADGLTGRENYESEAIRRACEGTPLHKSPDGRHQP